MPVVEAAGALLAGAASAAGAFLAGAASTAREAASAAREYVQRQREWWSPEKRPAEHPMACDCRDSLGLSHDMQYTTNDIRKHEKRAMLWWHPDRNKGVDRGFVDFKRIVVAFKDRRTRQRYAEEVQQETEVANRLGLDVQWRLLNEKFFLSLEEKRRTQAATSTQEQPVPETEFCHVFLDSSYSMRLESNQPGKTRLDVGKAAVSDLWPRFVDSPTTVHLIGRKGASRCLIQHSQDVDFRDEAWVLQKWTAERQGTYLWEYVHSQIEDYKDSKHDVIIITDGEDNRSGGDFHGLSGFNGLMQRMQGGRIRISLYLVGNGVCEKDAFTYRDVCIATGGFFSKDVATEELEDGEAGGMALQEFVLPLLLPEGERNVLAAQQQQRYLALLDRGEAQPFGWLMIKDSSSGSSGVPGAHSAFSPSRKRSANWAPEHPAPGVRVRLHGLQGAVDFNGHVGVCERWLPDKGRWQLKMEESGEPKLLKPANLIVCRG